MRLLPNASLVVATCVSLACASRAHEPTAADAADMRAVRIHGFGAAAAVLKSERVPRPVPGKGEILVRVLAAGVNPLDAKVRASASSFREAQLPLTLGWDVAGTVAAVGEGVVGFRAGDAVYGMIAVAKPGGGYAEYCALDASGAAPKPVALSFEQAAAMPLVALTARQALYEIADVSAGQTVLIHGGAGGVGSYAIQLAKLRGAKVIATASAENAAVVRELGADQAIDYKAVKFEEVVRGADVVLDTVGGDTLARSYGVLKPGGIVVSLLETPDAKALEAVGARGATMVVQPNGAALVELGRLADAGKLRPPSITVLPLAEAAAAHVQIETRHTRGKVVLRVAAP